MTQLQTVLIALVGVAFVAIGLAIGLESQPARSDGVTAGTVLIALVALVVGLWKIRGTPEASDGEPAVSWSGDDGFATPAPERTDGEPPLSSDGLVKVVERAGRTARESDTVDEGIAVVRPLLRETLRDALVQGGRSPADAEGTIDSGGWTDDRGAASVLSSEVEPPTRRFRDRLRAWLFPERTVRRRTRRAMGAIAEAADEALPAVPGQTAPRTVPVLHPRLEELRRGAGGELQRAVDPAAIARGSGPERERAHGDNRFAENEGDDRGGETDG